jgi:putative membrane protein
MPIRAIYQLLTINLSRTLPWVIGLGIYSLAIALFDRNLQEVHLTATIHTFLGLILGLLLVFRTNTAYDRWWEGRKLWGQLVNDCRNFAVKIATCVRAEPRDKLLIGERLISFALALKDHLRGGVRLQQLPGFEHDTATPKHVPAYIASEIYGRLERWRQSEQLGGFELLFLDRHAAALLDICGGCERIRSTPIAIGYRRFIRQAIAVYLVTLPWGLVDLLSYWTVPLVIVVSYLMVGIEVLAEDIEDPFGTDDDDLQLDRICAAISDSVREIVME